MTKTVLRAVVTLVASASIALAGATGVAAASPAPNTIGLTVEPAPIHIDRDGRSLAVMNEGSVPMTFTFESPEGWSIQPATIDIDPGDWGHVTLVGNGGDGTIKVIGVGRDAAAQAAGAAMVSHMVMDVRLYSNSPINWTSLVFTGLALIVGVAALVAFFRRARRYRLSFSVARRDPEGPAR